MKTISRALIKGTNWFLAGLTGLLGFACGRNAGVVEYGTPRAVYTVSGKVTDTAGNPLEGINVIVPSVDYRQLAAPGSNPTLPMNTVLVNDTLQTATDGLFEYTHPSFPSTEVTIRLKFEDPTAETYATDSTIVTFKSDDLKDQKGQYTDQNNKSIHIKLKRR